MPVDQHREQDREPLAIVGIGCRFPGDVASPADYWNVLRHGTDATRTVPDARWNAGRYHDPNPAKAGKMVTRRGGFLDRIDQFDAQFFGITPREANLIDPQQRLLLQTTWEALEDGGIPAETLTGTDVGVFIGGFTLDYQLLQNQGRTSRFRFKPHSATGMMMTMLANRISYTFDFRGPSMTIDTACSGSLVAVHLAAQSLWNGECHLALAGGVNIMVGPNTAVAESKSGFLSPDGRCKAFDESADGYARGEGGAVVVVKPLARALRDGDHVYAQILGTAVSQDGHTEGITVPSEDAQRIAITTALARAGVDPGEVGYVEAHGTGTPVGDPVEMRALAGALASARKAGDPLLIGSVKTNIGHLEAGAGVAGLIKAALVLEHGHIPANLHLENPSSRIPFGELNIDVPRVGRPFPAGNRRVAGVNSFGFGGTNAHVVLAEPPAPLPAVDRMPPWQPPLALLPISARSEEALAATAQGLAEHLGSGPDLTLADLGYTLSRRRSHLTHREVLIVDSLEDARSQLESLAADTRVPAGRTSAPATKLAFVCTGMGPQWWRMCRGLLDAYPVFADSIARSDEALSRYTDWSLIDELRRDENDSRMGETEVAQPANFAIQVALAEQLRHFGVTADAVIGHSAGEVAAHHLAGLLTFEQSIRVTHHRSRLQQRTSGLGRMLAVGLGADSLATVLDRRAFDEIGRRVSIAAINSPFAVTIGGDPEILDDIARQLGEAQIFHRYLAGTVPYHTHFMDTVRDDLHHALEGLSSGPASIPLYSTVTGERLSGYSAGAAYWWQNTRSTVLFESAIRRMLDDGYTHFVELGPHPVLTASILEIAGSQRTVALPAQRRNDDDSRTLMHCVGALYSHGYEIDWEALHPAQSARLVKLPSYPWQNKRFWNETPEAAEDLHYRPVHPLLGQPVRAVHPTWEVELSCTALPFLGDHQVQGSVVVPAAVFVEMALAAATETYGSRHSVEDLVLHRALILDDRCDPTVRTTLDQDKGTIEFAALTATGDGDFTWAVTATAELNTAPQPPRRDEAPPEADGVVSMRGDDFYARTRDLGFGYGEAFRSVDSITAGDRWAVAEIVVPDKIADDLGAYRFHPALMDGAFHTLFGTTFARDGGGTETHVPTRIRRGVVYGPPEDKMTVRVRVVSATEEEIESDITVANRLGEPLAVYSGFTVRSLGASSAVSTERIDKGLYEIQWVPQADDAGAGEFGARSWLVFADTTGFAASLVRHLRGRGQRVRTVSHGPVDALTENGDGFVTNPSLPEQVQELLETHVEREGELAGVVDCWPLDMAWGADEHNQRIGVLTALHLVKALSERGAPALHVVTGNAQPALGGDLRAVDQAALWGLGRVIGHQEFPGQWGGLIDIDDSDDCDATAARVCAHILSESTEDQVAIRGRSTFVPRLRPCTDLTTPFPLKLTAHATYVVTGGLGALGLGMAAHLAERGARHIVCFSRRTLPPRARWSQLTEADADFAVIEAVRRIERHGAEVSCAGVDVTDAEQVHRWLSDHLGDGGRPVRGIVHAAGSVDDRLLVTMTEEQFASVMAPKVTGTRVLDEAFDGHDLEFFVMFGSAGSVIAAPGQGNYAAANAFLDAFAHHRRARGLPALTIGWGPWSVGMVEKLALERIYAQRGIELITPAAGVRIFDRLINQQVPTVVAISADWSRARQAGFGGSVPPMFSELQASEVVGAEGESDAPILDVLAATADSERLDVVVERLRLIVAAVFDCAVTDVEPDETLDDLGLDSMMAMEFRVRINTMFSIDLPVLEILKGVSVNALAARVLAELHVCSPERQPSDVIDSERAATEDVEELIGQLSDDDLRQLLAELEGGVGDQPDGERP
ncbi:polyketide synthase family protein [Mycolicibacterium chubuense NBB4]|uniref:Polyketide synthase family protein n=2 Tax=Mycolicibacterium chubuense TaxID=1800 RepID=I4BP61_MYCCN|nr:polyketide synthase family protein [Mycolicibacterium chubuense NBB4]